MADLQERYETAVTVLSEMWVRSREDVEELLDMFSAWSDRLPDLVAESIDAVQQEVEDEEDPLTFSQGVGNISETLVEFVQDEAVAAIAGSNDQMAERLNGLVFNHEGVPGAVTGNERLEAEGRADKTTASLKQAGEKLKDAFRGR